jgi:hypothetical protein
VVGATKESRPRQATSRLFFRASLNLAAPAVTHHQGICRTGAKTPEILHLCNAKMSIALFSKTPI